MILLAGIFPMEGNSQLFEREGRKERKEARQAELEANFRALESIIQSKSFVLEAEFLQNRIGESVPVTSNLNFIRVNPGSVVLQTGTGFAPGYNGVGGITAEGSIGNWKVTKDEKRLNFRIYFNAMTDIGTYDVTMRVGADASAMATITGMTRGSLTYRGNLVASDNSRIFKGQRTF